MLCVCVDVCVCVQLMALEWWHQTLSLSLSLTADVWLPSTKSSLSFRGSNGFVIKIHRGRLYSMEKLITLRESIRSTQHMQSADPARLQSQNLQ